MIDYIGVTLAKLTFTWPPVTDRCVLRLYFFFTMLWHKSRWKRDNSSKCFVL